MYIPCLKDIAETFKLECYNRDYEYFKNHGFEPELHVFPQIWGSTALGFGGIGGQAMTSAYTTVAVDEYSGFCGVFFGTRMAYLIKKPNQKFFEDMKNERMATKNRMAIYIRKD